MSEIERVSPKYSPLASWLGTRATSPVDLTFTEMSKIVGPLPKSAETRREWWGNASRNPQASGWLSAGWMVDTVDLNTAHVTFRRGKPATRGSSRASGATGGGGLAPILDGTAALDPFCERAGYPTIEAAVAEQTIFLDPETVRQTNGGAVFPVIRDMTRRGKQAVLADGRRVVCCDNTTPKLAFLWAADRTTGRDTQFNHVWNTSSDPDAYTALWNVCCTPAFLAKATDTHDGVAAMLRYRSLDLFGFLPGGVEVPSAPAGYESLVWAESPPATDRLEARLRRRLGSSPKSRAAVAARTIGWLFSDGPDTSHTIPG